MVSAERESDLQNGLKRLRHTGKVRVWGKVHRPRSPAQRMWLAALDSAERLLADSRPPEVCPILITSENPDVSPQPQARMPKRRPLLRTWQGAGAAPLAFSGDDGVLQDQSPASW